MATQIKRAPKQTKIREIWNNDLLPRYRNYLEQYDEDKAWDAARQEIADSLENEADELDKYVDGTICLVGTMQKYGVARAACRDLKTDNVGKAISKAVHGFKGDNKLSLYLAEGELVLSQWNSENPDTPSVFSFRCVDPADIADGADAVAERSTSIAPIVKRVHGWR